MYIIDELDRRFEYTSVAVDSHLTLDLQGDRLYLGNMA